MHLGAIEFSNGLGIAWGGGPAYSVGEPSQPKHFSCACGLFSAVSLPCVSSFERQPATKNVVAARERAVQIERIILISWIGVWRRKFPHGREGGYL